MKKWIPITKEEYVDIFTKYRDQLTVSSTASWPDYVDTEWWFKAANTPSIKAHSTSMNPEESIHTYFKYKTVKG